MRLLSLFTLLFIISCSSLNYNNIDPVGTYIERGLNHSQSLTLNPNGEYTLIEHSVSCEQDEGDDSITGSGFWNLENGKVIFTPVEGPFFQYNNKLIIAKWNQKEILFKQEQLDKYLLNSSSFNVEFIKEIEY